MADTRLTTIIPWCQRPEIERTLSHNAPILEAMGSELLVVNCGGDADTVRRALASVRLRHAEQIDLPVQPFNKSLALNIGIHRAAGDVVLLLDADVLISGGLERLVETCAERRCFVTFNGVTECPPDAIADQFAAPSFIDTIIVESFTTFVWADGTSTRVQRGYTDYRYGRRFGPGLLIVRRQYLVDIEGFRSDFEGWGWEDVDVHLRLQRVLGLEPLYVLDTVVHLSHGDEVRDLRGRSSTGSDRINFMRACHSYAHDTFTGTFSQDVRTWGDQS